MRKTIIKILCISFVLIMCVGVLCACNNDDNDDNFRNPRKGEPEAGEFYSLQDAFYNGWLSKGDLRNIAYYWGGSGQRNGFVPTPKNPEELSEETQLAIKEDWADKHENNEEYGKIDHLKYCGTYDNLIAIYIRTCAVRPFVMDYPEIGGIKFSYPDPLDVIYVWKPAEE